MGLNKYNIFSSDNFIQWLKYANLIVNPFKSQNILKGVAKGLLFLPSIVATGILTSGLIFTGSVTAGIIGGAAQFFWGIASLIVAPQSAKLQRSPWKDIRNGLGKFILGSVIAGGIGTAIVFSLGTGSAILPFMAPAAAAIANAFSLSIPSLITLSIPIAISTAIIGVTQLVPFLLNKFKNSSKNSTPVMPSLPASTPVMPGILRAIPPTPISTTPTPSAIPTDSTPFSDTPLSPPTPVTPTASPSSPTTIPRNSTVRTWFKKIF